MTRLAADRANTRALEWRLFVTVWLLYAVHATTNVVRETYLALSLGSRLSVRVNEYYGLHPDLFEIPGRGAYINNNPGASILGAVPYGILVRPVVALAVRLRPDIAAPKPPAQYDDPRPNRARFLNAARARGLDIVLGLAALGIQVTLMAPLGGLATVLMFLLGRARQGSDRVALCAALIYAFGTPAMFRSAFLNQNVIIAHLVLAAFIALAGWRPRAASEAPTTAALLLAGCLLGFALVCDYSGAPLLLVFGLWVMTDAWGRGGARTAVRESATYALGALGPLAVLFGYQWAAFGHPIWPAQRYMPPTEYSVRGWFGFTLPTWQLLAGNLFDPRYGLFAFSPMLAAAFAAPFVRRGTAALTARELFWIFAAFVALWFFSSANQFASLQWNTGVRYMVPAAPLLFMAAVPVLLAVPRVVRWALVLPSLLISWAVTMTRESVPTALGIVAREGIVLPITTVLERVSSGYPGYTPSRFVPLLVYLALAAVLWWLWRGHLPVRGAHAT